MNLTNRKDDHIRICLEKDVSASYNYWDDIHLLHHAIPVSNFRDIRLDTELFGKKLKAPVILSAMTGGTALSVKINENLARAASEFGLGLGVGSQRCTLEKQRKNSRKSEKDEKEEKSNSGRNTEKKESETEMESASFDIIRKYNIPLVIANIGAPQLIAQKGKKGLEHAEIKKIMDMIGADLLAVHLNYTQEAIQPEGDLEVSGLTEAIKKVAKEFPVIVKETGAGIGFKTASMLKKLGVIGIDVGGLGGTSFAAVEYYRALEAQDKVRAAAGEVYRDWGIPTPVALHLARVDLPLIATGGLRNGLDAARAIALGASAAGFARAVLEPAMVSYDALKEKIESILHQLKVAVFLTGSFDILSFSENVSCIITGPTREWFQSLGVEL
ncbi:MAG: isopentenyl-diphosphate delta-isomerase [Thermoplasmata archaeon]